MQDSGTSVEDLKKMVNKFCEERDWDQFHNSKDLAIGMVTEASELLQLFRFKDTDECTDIMKRTESRTAICDELSDVLYFVLRFAHMNDIDLSSALKKKLLKNDIKYPVESCKGSNKKYDEL